MAVTKTISTSYGQRLGNSFKGIVGGIVFIIVGICLLWWNEKRTVHRAQALGAGREIVAEGVYDSLNAGDEGKLVHISGSAVTDDVLQDPVFHVSVNGFSLTRNVEMYQWLEEEHKETKEKIGGTKETTITYTYKKSWSSTRSNSESFEEAGHDNPPMLYTQQNWLASQATFGAHKLTSGQIQRIGGQSTLAVTSIPEIMKAVDALQTMQSQAAEAAKKALAEAAQTQEGAIAETVAVSAEKLKTSLFDIPDLQVNGNGFYIGKNPSAPEIGDLRITFSYKPSPADISIICQQLQDTFAPYATKTGNLDEMASGIVSADMMFASAEKSNKIFCWLLRLIGFILISGGIRRVLDPLATLGVVLPFLGRILGAGLSFISAIVGAALSLLVIAVAWLFYRPILSISLLVCIIALIVFLKKKGSSQAA